VFQRRFRSALQDRPFVVVDSGSVIRDTYLYPIAVQFDRDSNGRVRTGVVLDTVFDEVGEHGLEDASDVYLPQIRLTIDASVWILLPDDRDAVREERLERDGFDRVPPSFEDVDDFAGFDPSSSMRRALAVISSAAP